VNECIVWRNKGIGCLLLDRCSENYVRMCVKYQCEFIFSEEMGSINIVRTQHTRHKCLMSCNDTSWINVAFSAEKLF
jgi:hypothetical protein